MNFNSLICSYRNQFKKIEKLTKKCVKHECSILFNETCLKNGLYPKYTTVKLCGLAVTDNNKVNELKNNVLQKEIDDRNEALNRDKENLESLTANLRSNVSDELFTCFTKKLRDIRTTTNAEIKRRHIKKLNQLYDGQIYLKESKDKFINLSQLELTETDKTVLNLGLNCHLQSKFNPTKKKLELEILYQSLLNLEKEHTVTISDGLVDSLRNEGNKIRCNSNSTLLTKAQKESCKKLKNNENIVIRKADKSNIYVILDKEQYKSKLDDILSDQTKFEKLDHNPSNQLKKKLNAIIKHNNGVANNLKLPELVGDYKPGYIYGNCKIHKNENNPPLRPIISQIPSPTYRIAKTLTKIIEPYLPNRYSLKSTDEFLDVIKVIQPNGILASLDVESLYTNVPIDETIKIIIENVYNHDRAAPPILQKETLKELLEICTKEAPFQHIDGSLYRQVDGIAMGSPLGCIFANYYMCSLENDVIPNLKNQPACYARYVDDIFVVINSEDDLDSMKNILEEKSVLKFTHELGYKKLNFLDVTIDISNNQLDTSVYTKITNTGDMLNYQSECPMKYKTGVIKAMLHRSKKISSNPETFEKEITRLKQVFTNNNYPAEVIDNCIEVFQKHKLPNNGTKSPSTKNTVAIFYKNQMNQQYKKDEKVLKDIIKNNVKMVNTNDELKINVYYSNLKTKHLIMKNNLGQKLDKLDTSWAVYKVLCPMEDCELLNPMYIGQTRNTIKTRLLQHSKNGSICEHLKNHHNMQQVEPHILEQNCEVVQKLPDFKRLVIFEALTILKERPSMNRQSDNFINPLKLFSRQSRTLPVSTVQSTNRRDRDTTDIDIPPSPAAVPATAMHSYALRPRTQQ